MHSLHVCQMFAGFVLLLLVTNASILCKILVKIGPVVLAENILIKIALPVHVVVQHMSSNISGCTGPIFAIISPMKALCMPMTDLNLIRQFVKGRCYGNQISLV